MAIETVFFSRWLWIYNNSTQLINAVCYIAKCNVFLALQVCRMIHGNMAKNQEPTCSHYGKCMSTKVLAWSYITLHRWSGEVVICQLQENKQQWR